MAPLRRVWLLTIGLLLMANHLVIAAESPPSEAGPGIFDVTGAIAGRVPGGARFDQVMPENPGASTITVAATDQVKTSEGAVPRAPHLQWFDQRCVGHLNCVHME